MKHRPGRLRALWLCAGLLFASRSVSWAYQPVLVEEKPISPEAITKDLSRSAAESDTILDFIRQRTRIGVGFDEEFNDNVLLQDNNKREDYISTLEGLVFFADPRGALLYGTRYEFNAYRYHRLDRNAIDHDFLAFVDVDPGGRVQFHADYLLLVNNRLTFGTEGTDILRRSTDFQRSVEHAWIGKLRYALNETNAFVPSVEYSIFDDQTLSDASTDRKRFRAILDMDHDLTETWTLFGGYTFDDYLIPGNKLKSLTAHGVRLGVRHELTGVDQLEAAFEIQRAEFKNTTLDTNPSYYAKWIHQVSPRTTLELNYSEMRLPSFATGRDWFRIRNAKFKVSYELTPLILLTLDGNHERLRSRASDLSRGSTLVAETIESYSLKSGLKWQLREQTHATLDYSYGRSKSRDYTNHTVGFGIETTF